MTENDVKEMIQTAFADAPSPGENFRDISATEWDEGIVAYFRGTTWRGHRTIDLRHHAAALSFFTDKAFRYWLPAFILADLEDPAQADIIAEHIASSFLPSEYGRPNERLGQFTSSELEAIAAFMDHCSRTSNKIPGVPDRFAEAAGALRAHVK